jgi:SagB-type dehydrogenase family enzyme
MNYRKVKQKKKISAVRKLKDFRVRRPKSLIAFWEDNKFIVENYLSNKQIEVSPLVTLLLHGIDKYQRIGDILSKFGNIPKSKQIVYQLIDNDLLVVEGGAYDVKDYLVEQSWKWKQDARYYHYSSQNVHYEGDIQKQRAILAKLARELPPPSPFKDYKRQGIKLDGTYSKETMSTEFWQVLLNRRTRRSYLRKKMSFYDFSTILLWTWGKTHTIDSNIGRNLLKTSPSAGARHPIEVYPVVFSVQGVKPGIYHYSVRRHQLECIKKGTFRRLVLRLCSNQPWIRDTAVVFFMTAIVARSMWKYNHSHAYRVILLDAGHLGQTFQLVCTKLGLAPFTTAATNDKAIETALGIDGVTEFPVCAVAAGIPTDMKPRLDITVIESLL